eukprot:SAG31_NODE_54_length_29987_cov_4.570664_11_plen_141_part_00
MHDAAVRLLQLWNIKTGQITRSYGSDRTQHGLDIYSLDCSSDGRFIASGSGDKTVKLWGKESGECLYTLGDTERTGPTDGVTSVSVSPDGSIVAAVPCAPDAVCKAVCMFSLHCWYSAGIFGQSGEVVGYEHGHVSRKAW